MKTSPPRRLFPLKNLSKLARAGLWSAALLCGLAAVTPCARGAVITGDTADNELTNTETVGDPSAVAIRVGASSGGGRDAIFIFQLPDLGLVANPFSTATLTLTYVSKTNTPGFNVDLWGLDGSASASTTIPSGSFFNTSSSDPNNFLIQDDFITTTTATGTYTTSVGGSANLVAFLNGEYASGANIGKYVFIRANPDAALGGTNGYNIGTANNATPAFQPLITYTAVPEPSSAALLALGLVALGARTRRRL